MGLVFYTVFYQILDDTCIELSVAIEVYLFFLMRKKDIMCTIVLEYPSGMCHDVDRLLMMLCLLRVCEEEESIDDMLHGGYLLFGRVYELVRWCHT